MKNKKKSMKTRKSMKINKPPVPDFNFNGSETLTLLRRWQDISEPVYILINPNHVPDHCVYILIPDNSEWAGVGGTVRRTYSI